MNSIGIGVFVYILNFLEVKDLLNMRLTCKDYCHWASSDSVNVWTQLYIKIVTVTIKDKSNPTRHKGGRTGANCVNGGVLAQCNIATHLIYNNMITEIPEDKKIKNGFFAAYRKECQDPQNMRLSLIAERLKIIKTQRKIKRERDVIYGPAWRRGQRVRKKKELPSQHTLIGNRITTIQQEYVEIRKKIEEKIKSLDQIILINTHEQGVNRGKYLCMREDLLLKSMGLTEPEPDSKTKPKHKTRTDLLEERFAALENWQRG